MFDIFFVQQLVNGLSVGFIYALMAIGFTLIFGVLNVVNFAHGEIYMIGSYAGWLAITYFAPPLFVVILVRWRSARSPVSALSESRSSRFAAFATRRR